MRHSIPLICLTLCATVPGTVTWGPGQDAPQSQPRVETISVDFSGGTLADFVAAVRAAGAGINIVVSPRAADVVLPPMKLQQTRVFAALEAVGRIVAPEYAVEVGHSEHDPGSKPIYSLTVRHLVKRTRTQSGKPHKEVRVFSIRTLTQKLPGDPDVPGLVTKPETILTAIETGIEAGGEGERARIRYHADSGLLFVFGTAAQTSLVGEILRSMTNDCSQIRRSALQASLGKRTPSGAGRDDERRESK